MLRIIVLSVLLVACGGGVSKPLAPVVPVVPDERLVGSWAFEESDLLDVMQAGARRHYQASLSAADIGGMLVAARLLEKGPSDPFEDFRLTRISFDANGIYQDNHGGLGSWDVDRNALIIDDKEMCKYFVNGGELTLIFRLGSPPFDLSDDMGFLDGSTFRFFLVRR